MTSFSMPAMEEGMTYCFCELTIFFLPAFSDLSEANVSPSRLISTRLADSQGSEIQVGAT